ncbi:hypothetical protein QN277_022721 [Acacia crassicarpa]|uniref:Uncharacterized protein n=1 Tax=Acacia crassicarpa TaxID=499986 RepID=A0AAE1JJG7_9FABA|nr:hypothetical protein QN277_022721 [Acacia crassicarpa]
MPYREICTSMKEPRPVARKFLARPQRERVGVVVRRSIGRFELKCFDPLLLLDEFLVSAPDVFPDHPQRYAIWIVNFSLFFKQI